MTSRERRLALRWERALTAEYQPCLACEWRMLVWFTIGIARVEAT